MAQNSDEVAQLLKSLNAHKDKSKSGGKKSFSCKRTTFDVAGTNGTTVDSWRFQEWDYKRDDLPTYARGLFTTRKSNGQPEIVIRGYDKFFNIDEVNNTQWRNIEINTVGPYELSVKENGCIIFMSGLEDGTLLVCSKHSTGARSDRSQSHSIAGEEWIKKHLAEKGKTTRDLAMTLRKMNVTAVGELCDDNFEEHVLEYPPDKAGLYLHGLNLNLPEFATLSSPEVHEFADTWGLKKAQYVIIRNLDDVKNFLAECAETGSWSGRETEGFVVRCKLRDRKGDPCIDWFFKYKFEEPYLMYRQWRECTKAVIAGKPPKYKKHKKVTEEYLLFARRQLQKNPQLGKAYQQNHGIIKMRDDFLAERGQKGSDIIAQELANGDGGAAEPTNIVLVPIATIGCGKTTVASALVKLFDFGHIQNDNIEGKGSRPQRFVAGITTLMTQHKVVIADRNNHQMRERAQLIDDVSRLAPDTHFVALHYVHHPKNEMLDDIRKVTRERVLVRGDNHQTIRAGSKSQEEIVGIMEGFLNRFEPCDTTREPDAKFDDVIDLDVSASSLENLETVVHRLYYDYPGALPKNMPSDEDMQRAIESAMNATVTLHHDLTFNSTKSQSQKNNKRQRAGSKDSTPGPSKTWTADELVGKLEYFSLVLPHDQIMQQLLKMFNNASPDESRMFSHLRKSRRIQNEFHVTLIHRASAGHHQSMWEQYVGEYRHALLPQAMQDTNQLTPPLGQARIQLERLIWDERIMAFSVRILSREDGSLWSVSNFHPHITIGTAIDSIKPKESNDLLAKYYSGQQGQQRIWSKDVTGAATVEGIVQPVMQRGTFGRR